MQRFRAVSPAQKFAAAHASIHNHFNHDRHLNRRDIVATYDVYLSIPVIEKRSQVVEQFSKVGEEFQKVGKDGFDAAVCSFGEVNKGFQAISAEVTDYSKKAFEEFYLCLRAAHRCEVDRAGVRDSVPVCQEGFRYVYG